MPTNFNKMNVNFNNLRAQAAYALDRLTKTLNYGLLEENEYAINKKGNDTWGDVLVSADDIQNDIDSLRQMIVAINCVFEPDNPNFKEMMDEIDASGGVACFNEERE